MASAGTNLSISAPTSRLAPAILQASDSTHVPTFVLASMYMAGFSGSPQALGTQLERWYNETGGTSWINALAAYHAGSTTGLAQPGSIAYAKNVLLLGEKAPPALFGSMSVGSALSLAGVEIAGGLVFAGAAGAAGAAAVEAATDVGAAGAGTAEAAGAGGAAGTAASTAASKIASTAGSDLAKVAAVSTLAGLLSGWTVMRFIELIGGAVLLFLGLKQLATVGGAFDGGGGAGGGTRVVPIPV